MKRALSLILLFTLCSGIQAQPITGIGTQRKYWVPTEQFQFGVYTTLQNRGRVEALAGESNMSSRPSLGLGFDIGYYMELIDQLALVTRAGLVTNNYHLYVTEAIKYDDTFDVLYFAGEVESGDIEYFAQSIYNVSASGQIGLSYLKNFRGPVYLRFEAGLGLNYQLAHPVDFGVVGSYFDNQNTVDAFLIEFEGAQPRYQWAGTGRVVLGSYSKPRELSSENSKKLPGNNSFELSLNFMLSNSPVAKGSYRFLNMEEDHYGDLQLSGSYFGFGITYGISRGLRLP